MNLFPLGQKVTVRHCVHSGLCSDRKKVFLQFTHELSAIEMAAVRDFVVESLSSPDGELAFAGACHLQPFWPSGFAGRRTRMVFGLCKSRHAPEVALETLSALCADFAQTQGAPLRCIGL